MRAASASSQARLDRRWLLLVALVVPSFAPAQAGAQCGGCGCPSDGAPFLSRTGPRAPANIAPNARIFARLAQYQPSSFTFRDELGADVPFRLEPAGDSAGTAYWIVPESALSPGTYRLAVARRDSSTPYEREVVVVADLDTTAPPVTGVRIETGSLPSYCSDVVGALVTWDTMDTSTEALLTELVAEVELSRAGLPVAHLFSEQAAGVGTYLFGASDDPNCLGAAHAEGILAGEELTASVRIWDQAGNATPPTSATFRPRLTQAPSGPCPPGCSVGARGKAHAAPVILLIVLAWLGRRRGSIKGAES